MREECIVDRSTSVSVAAVSGREAANERSAYPRESVVERVVTLSGEPQGHRAEEPAEADDLWNNVPV